MSTDYCTFAQIDKETFLGIDEKLLNTLNIAGI